MADRYRRGGYQGGAGAPGAKPMKVPDGSVRVARPCRDNGETVSTTPGNPVPSTGTTTLRNDYDLEFVCESCGQVLKRLMLHTCEERRLQPCGPAFETRTHRIGNTDHYWNQPHNCLRPTDDACWICNEDQQPSYTRPHCCP